MTAFSQDNPVRWSFATEKVSDKEFDVVFTANVDNGWYVYSQFLGEDGPIPTTFNFAENADVELIGKASETGTIKKDGYDELFGMDVLKFGGTATFKQRIKISNGADKVSGYLEFMTCDEMRCLPPAEVDFSISLN